jgi:hypothetical protein
MRAPLAAGPVEHHPGRTLHGGQQADSSAAVVVSKGFGFLVRVGVGVEPLLPALAAVTPLTETARTPA